MFTESLSSCERQRIGIARDLYHNPKLLVLDEVTSTLDSATEADIIKALHSIAKDKTVVMVTHRESTLLCCDKIFRLSDDGTKLCQT